MNEYSEIAKELERSQGKTAITKMPIMKASAGTLQRP